MSLEHLALTETGNFPIRHDGNVHNGKVRSVYWLTSQDSSRLINEKRYDVLPDSELGVMIISDRISAFDCNWRGEDGLSGVSGKGAALNAISEYWFEMFNKFDSIHLAGNHILDVPHPLVWIVDRTKPILIEAIARQYITGSMWRDYKNGVRNFCGYQLPEGLQENEKLDALLITPSTKGVIRGIKGIPEEDDVNITREQISMYYEKFGFKSSQDIIEYERLLKLGFWLISKRLKDIGQIFVDTKFEFGYSKSGRGDMIYIDEAGTPDSSRMWDAKAYAKGIVVENSKEEFRQFLLHHLDRDVLLNKKRMVERKELAAKYRVPVEEMMNVSNVYQSMAEQITGKKFSRIENPREEVLDTLNRYKLVD